MIKLNTKEVDELLDAARANEATRICNKVLAAEEPLLTAICAVGQATIKRGSYALPHIA